MSVSSSSSSDFSYFSSLAPLSSSSSTSPNPTPASTPYPVITATVTARNPRSPLVHTTTPSAPPPSQEVLQQFALRFPNPPPLSLSSLRHPTPEVSVTPPYASSRHSGYDDLPSPMDRSRRMPASSQSPLMNIFSSHNKHTLSVQLPTSIQPEMVTISANKGDKIKIVADAWHMEDDCHYEWQISFPPHDIDMSAVHARFESDGRLTIDVRRIPRY